MKVVSYDKLVGKVFTNVEINDDKTEMVFTNDESGYKFYHEQDCCESVEIVDINGLLSDLIGKPILQAESVSMNSSSDNYDGSQTWTFYKFATIQGFVTVRWLGESNGYYSEEVNFAEISCYKG